MIRKLNPTQRKLYVEITPRREDCGAFIKFICHHKMTVLYHPVYPTSSDAVLTDFHISGQNNWVMLSLRCNIPLIVSGEFNFDVK